MARGSPGERRRHPGVLAGGKLFVNYLQNVVSRVKVFEPDGKHLRDIALPVLGTVTSIRGQWDNSEAFFSFASFHLPSTIYRYDVAKGRREVWRRPRNKDTYFHCACQRNQARQLEPDAADRLRRLQREQNSGIFADGGAVGRGGASTRCRTCEGAESSARNGIGPGCSRRSRTSSTISLLPPSGG